MPTKALVVAPHHDDETIGAGGLIAHLSQRGVTLDVIHVFDGSTGIPGLSAQDCSAKRLEEARAAARCLGASVLPGLDLADRSKTAVPDIIPGLIKAIRRSTPQLLIAPHLNDGDFEHKLVSQAADEAHWMASSDIFPELGERCPSVSALLGYEVWTPMQDVNLTLDISPVIEKKRAALNCYKSQNEESNWAHGGLGLSAFRGTTQQGGGYAEVFTLRRAKLSKMDWTKPFAMELDER